MEKKHALIIAFLVTGLIASNHFFIKEITGDSIKESAVIKRAIDGDTLELEDGRIIRLLNINSPEKNAKSHELSFNYLKLYENKSLELEIIGEDKYKRNLARIYYNEAYINLEIVKLGFASKFLVEESELNEFSDAESDAVERGIGIWNKSSYFGCFDSEIDEQSEIIILKNNCSAINLQGFILKDESRKVYKFPNIQIGKIALHSGTGNDNSTDIFWNSKNNIWNNDRDSLYLFDSGGNIADYEDYGY